MERPPSLSVIIVTNRGDDEILPLKKFEESSFDDYEIVIRHDDGICAARNRGIEEASSDKLVFIDDDAIPGENYLDIVNRALDDHAAVAGRVFQPDDAPFSEWDVSQYDQGDDPKTVDTLVGCNMAFRREVFETVGGFDERFQWGHDEVELAERVVEEFDIHYEPDLTVEHSFADSRRHYWAKQALIGTADIQWARKRGASKREQLASAVPHPGYFLVRRPTKSVGYALKKYNRFREALRS